MMKELMKYKLHDFYGKDYWLIPILHRYSKNNGVAIELLDADDGDTFAFLTVNLGGEAINQNVDSVFVDINNNRWAEKFIETNALATKTQNFRKSGFCTYTEYKFNLNKINVFEEDDL